MIDLIIWELETQGDTLHLVDLAEVLPILEALTARFPTFHLILRPYQGRYLLVVFLGEA